jgi:hypothetical protein
MLNDTLTLGVTTTLLAFVKRFADVNKSVFAVVGLAANAARTLTISHQPASSGRVRTMVRLDETDVDPGSSSGATGMSSTYVVFDRAPFKSAADMQAMRARLKTLVDDTALWDKLLNQEV